jgi:ABC-2 type transport system ATP-binding protein
MRSLSSTASGVTIATAGTLTAGPGEGTMADHPAIECVDVTRVYKLRGARRKEDLREIVALDGVTLDIGHGELFGLLGPNGAGKTTLIKILATLLLPTRGSARVVGLDVVSEPQEIRRHISMVSGGETSGYGLLTVEENLWMFARFYGLEDKVARARVAALLEVVGIADRRRTKVSDLSTGLRQKMNFVRGFVSDPTVVFLDEPTLGLDVTAARDVRAYIRTWLTERPDRTILLTTHYMAEADEMCDRLAIIDRGRLLALESPERLKHQLRRESVYTLRVAPLATPPSRDAMIEAVPGVRQVTVTEGDGFTELSLILTGDEVLSGVLAHVAGRGSSLISLEKRDPTLEDVFIDLVGRGLDVDTSQESEDGRG